jgi:hypothetical protein
VRVRSLAFFGAGYVLGTRAGRERYKQIVAAAQTASKRLDDYSGRFEPLGRKATWVSGRVDEIKARLQNYGEG